MCKTWGFGYSRLAIYLATPGINMYKQGGLSKPPYILPFLACPQHATLDVCVVVYIVLVFLFFFFLFFFLFAWFCAHIYILEYIQFQCFKQLLSSAVSTTPALPWVAMPLRFNYLAGLSMQHIGCWCLRSNTSFFFFFFFRWGLPHPCSIGMSLSTVPNSVLFCVVVGPSWGPSDGVLATLLIFSSSLYGSSMDSSSFSLLRVTFDFLFFLGFHRM